MSTDNQMATFVAMSAVLTGFNASVIAPSLDPIDLKSAYLALLQEYDAALLTQLLAQYTALAGQGLSAQQIADTLIAAGEGSAPAAASAQLARAIVKLWYLGSWYPPDNPAATSVVSANAYVGGLAWRAGQTKAMGWSEYAFGYWSQPPLPLSAFTGNGGKS